MPEKIRKQFLVNSYSSVCCIEQKKKKVGNNIAKRNVKVTRLSDNHKPNLMQNEKNVFSYTMIVFELNKWWHNG